MSTVTPRSSSPALDTFRDIILWRRKKVSATLLLVSTATWVFEVYQFNFITVVSWLTIFILASVFLWGNILSFSAKPPKCPIWSYRNRQPWRLQTSRTVMEDVLRWMFRVTVEENWYNGVDDGASDIYEVWGPHKETWRKGEGSNEKILRCLMRKCRKIPSKLVKQEQEKKVEHEKKVE
ncbi:hypothetical protein F3Y22_tig00110430pilonHSYRG00084 [Hibiscus syriacus]|uniref:Reticulon-like protein n=1 Tax=Hibiscus syriacus TaxID=106335 RepID=A0A6A3ANK6_HIBSY|nr:hypothetical protein F3Y22_tig00110430pilonHSYRG00084 [Hibiscus syriacus]